MVVNKKVTGKSTAMPMGLTIGVVVSLLLSFAGAMIAANLVVTGTLGQDAIGYCAIVILMVSPAVGAVISALMIKHRWMIVCLSVGGIYYLALLAITALFFGGQYQGMGVTALVVLGTCGAVGLLGLRTGKGSRHKGAKRHFR